MSSETKLGLLGTGAIIGVVGMSLSGLSNKAFGAKLGYDQFGFVNLIKVGVITGASSSLVLFLHESLWNKIIEKFKNIPQGM